MKGEKEKRKLKYKALLLSLLMILPIVAVAFPTNASITGPVVWVNPNAIEKEGPCLVSETFDVEVKLWNKKDLTGVGVYAFDFTLNWSGIITTDIACVMTDPFISLVSVAFVAPWDHYYVIVDEIDNELMTYHLAITALDGSDALEEVQIVLATLTFHIDCEPLYPDEWTTTFNLECTLTDLVDGKPVDVAPVEVDDGTFSLTVAQPDVYIAPEEICEYKVGMTHTIEFYISNINKVYGFGFAITFPNLKLEADVQSVVICDAFPPPYEYLLMYVYDNMDDTSTIVVHIQRPCEKPTVTHQEGPAATFTVTSIYDFPEFMIPLCQDDEITLEYAYVLSKCGCDGEGDTVIYGYMWMGADFPLDVTDLVPIGYYWRPRVGDLNLDGAVDITDLDLLAAEYGEDYGLGGWGNLDEINTIVDIYDFVVLAKYYGKPFTCMIEDAVCWPDP